MALDTEGLAWEWMHGASSSLINPGGLPGEVAPEGRSTWASGEQRRPDQTSRGAHPGWSPLVQALCGGPPPISTSTEVKEPPQRLRKIQARLSLLLFSQGRETLGLSVWSA